MKRMWIVLAATGISLATAGVVLIALSSRRPRVRARVAGARDVVTGLGRVGRRSRGRDGRPEERLAAAALHRLERGKHGLDRRPRPRLCDRGAHRRQRVRNRWDLDDRGCQRAWLREPEETLRDDVLLTRGVPHPSEWPCP